VEFLAEKPRGRDVEADAEGAELPDEKIYNVEGEDAYGQIIQNSYYQTCHCEEAFYSDRSNLTIKRRLPRRPSASSQ